MRRRILTEQGFTPDLWIEAYWRLKKDDDYCVQAKGVGGSWNCN